MNIKYNLKTIANNNAFGSGTDKNFWSKKTKLNSKTPKAPGTKDKTDIIVVVHKRPVAASKDKFTPTSFPKSTHARPKASQFRTVTPSPKATNLGLLTNIQSWTNAFLQNLEYLFRIITRITIKIIPKAENKIILAKLSSKTTATAAANEIAKKNKITMKSKNFSIILVDIESLLLILKYLLRNSILIKSPSWPGVNKENANEGAQSK